MKEHIKRLVQYTGYDIVKTYKETKDIKKIKGLYHKYKNFTMIQENDYIQNLLLCLYNKSIEGAIVECGVWRGGMIASIAELFGIDRNYYLFDSFEGLPIAKEIDGESALKWQNDKTSPWYYDNCSAEIRFAEEAMQMAGINNCTIVKGWFNESLSKFPKKEQIAILRLDADWYDSTMDCLIHLYPQVEKGGIIIIDDYYNWEGCTKAVHDYLSTNAINDRICQFNNKVCYIVKQ